VPEVPQSFTVSQLDRYSEQRIPGVPAEPSERLHDHLSLVVQWGRSTFHSRAACPRHGEMERLVRPPRRTVADAGHALSRSAEHVTSDQVFTDHHDGTTGYLIIDAGSMAGAVELAQGCPALGTGARITVYQALEAEDARRAG